MWKCAWWTPSAIALQEELAWRQRRNSTRIDRHRIFEEITRLPYRALHHKNSQLFACPTLFAFLQTTLRLLHKKTSKPESLCNPNGSPIKKLSQFPKLQMQMKCTSLCHLLRSCLRFCLRLCLRHCSLSPQLIKSPGLQSHHQSHNHTTCYIWQSSEFWVKKPDSLCHLFQLHWGLGNKCWSPLLRSLNPPPAERTIDVLSHLDGNPLCKKGLICCKTKTLDYSIDLLEE